MNRLAVGGAGAGLLMLIGVLGWSQGVSRNPSAGATFRGVDASGHEVRVHQFGLVGYEDAPSWQGWVFQEGTGLYREEYTTNQEVWPLRWPDPKSKEEPTVEARRVGDEDGQPRLEIQFGPGAAILVTREFPHRVLNRKRGFTVNGWGCIKEYRGEFPDLRGGDELSRAVFREIRSRCVSEAREFTEGILTHTREAWQEGWPVTMSRWTLEEHWQVRLLSGDIASFTVWRYPNTGGNGNSTRFAGVNWIRDGDHLRELDLPDLFRSDVRWESQLRQRCVSKLARVHAPEPADVLDPRVHLSVFTMSPEGLQLYFNPYTVGSGADGAFVIHFDDAELADLVRPDGPLARRR
jgi:hypothetical protein